MILILRIIKDFSLLTIVLFAVLPLAATAQSSLSLSVSPTIFEMTANPGQEWSSSIRVINANPYDITVYTDIVNFLPQDEGGQPRFIPVLESEATGDSLAEWLALEETAITIPAEQTVEIPFSAQVPAEASPGGHFAALRIGTKAPEVSSQSSQVQTSQVVTSLVFLRVTGDIIEDGRIRDFRTQYKVMDKPEVEFELRFQNTGNVHVLPRGEIKITNMWGKERGTIPVNQQYLFGNVLPDQIRKYSYTWSGEWSLADIGRYTAEVTLGFGADTIKFTDSQTHFWVIPWKILSTVIISFVFFVIIVTWGIKLYVRKMLMLAGVSTGQAGAVLAPRSKKRQMSLIAPIEAGMLDLRGNWQQETTLWGRVQTLVECTVRYRVFLSISLLILLFIISVIWYIQAASEPERAYDVTVNNQGAEQGVTISSEELKYQELKDAAVEANDNEADPALPEILIVNRSGVSGLAAQLRLYLEQNGYQISEIQNDLGVEDENTVIVYDPSIADEALAVSQIVYGALLSAYPAGQTAESPITVYVGKDLENAVQ